MSAAKSNPLFTTVSTWADAEPLIDFKPLRPRNPRGHDIESFAIHVRDHRKRELSKRSRTLEVHYGAFVLSQSWKGNSEARRQALGVSYGTNPQTVDIAGREGRIYSAGPEPEPGDIDPRMPAVVAWCDGEMFYLVASERLEADALLEIARSCY